MKKELAVTIRGWQAAVVCAALGTGMVLSLAGGCAQRPAGPVVRVSGAWALYPMMARWAQEFRKTHPEVRIDVSAGGASKGAADVLARRTEIGMVSRSIRPEELRTGAFGVPVVRDGVFATVNAANPVLKELSARGVTREVFIALWVGARPLTWGQAAGRREVHDRIRPYTRADACGAAETWAGYLGTTQSELHGVAESGDDRLAEALKRDPLAIGYNGMVYAYDAKTGEAAAGLAVVPIDANGDGKLDEAEDFYGTLAQAKQAIATGAYPAPLTRQIYLLTRGKPRGLVREFMLWVLTDGQRFVDEAGYVELPKEKLQAAIEKLR